MKVVVSNKGVSDGSDEVTKVTKSLSVTASLRHSVTFL
jgi:hypothetical protein